MSTRDTVAIVGVGLIGGSIGRALLKRGLARRVIGIGRREASLAAAKQLGAVTETTTDLEVGVAEADFVVVCTPVEQIVSDVRRAAAITRPGVPITDAGSTKAQLVDELSHDPHAQSRFVGSHPLAGSERRGPEASDPELFVDRLVLITPTRTSSANVVGQVKSFWQSLGARIKEMDPEEHDQALAFTSHLPHLVAASLAAATPPEWLELTAGGWRDTTRIAGGDPELWRQILQSNRQAVLHAARAFEQWWTEFRQAVSDGGDSPGEGGLKTLLEKAKQVRDQWAQAPPPANED